MKIILTSCFWEYGLDEFGREAAKGIIEKNGQRQAFREVFGNRARVLIIASDPCDHEGNDRMLSLMNESFTLSGFGVSEILVCDERRPELVERLSDFDVLVLSGGHVPTENKFLDKIRLRERLSAFRGNIVALSAGSMNCAKDVYSIPELDGEASDPNYKRRISGLGLTDVNVFPHFQYLRNAEVDGLNMLTDIAFPDSFEKEIIAINDGSYIFIDGECHTLFGEAYLIKDGTLLLLCKDGERIRLEK